MTDVHRITEIRHVGRGSWVAYCLCGQSESKSNRAAVQVAIYQHVIQASRPKCPTPQKTEYGRVWLFDARGMSIEDPAAVLEAAKDGRHGGDCTGRWDSENYWGAQKSDQIAADLELLRPMLDNYPIIPAGFDGWWTYQEVKK